MESWIKSLIALALSPVRILAQGAADRIAAVYGAFTNALGRIRVGFATWTQKGATWVVGQVRYALAVAVYLRWLARIELPRIVRQGLADATRWAGDRVAWALALVRTEIASVRDWLIARIHDAVTLVSSLRTWTQARIDEIRTAVRALLDRVFGPLGTPERLATWILAPLIGALVAWALDHAEELAEMAWRRRRFIETRAVDITTRIIDRIL